MAMSTATTDSTGSARLPRSQTVRIADVVRSPRRWITSDSGRADLLSFTPARARTGTLRGTVTSTGSLHELSSPKSHAAVRPENAYFVGMRREMASSFSLASCGNPAHAYWPWLVRV